ncbi:MAG: acyltransferase [Gammaproteobacteria bacterium]|nr:acyltransferase [Rhodospirillales bacterium]MDH3989645.1 acyltransferase [Gammaproteobacteria bacterium]
MRYRAEIDGLRAVAVVPVILFHAGFEVFAGGFVGVDVFFVISGFLITSIILSEMDEGKFSLLNFYERRARRILPALFFVMAACVPFAWVWLMPQEMEDFSNSIIATSTFWSNILFWLESGYFDRSAELKPLLHTWSLAAEEQYYILFPLFLMLTWRLGKRWILVTLAAVFITSLSTAQFAPSLVPHPKVVSGAFYLLPTRGWEILIGAFAAFYCSEKNVRSLPSSMYNALASAGLALIAYAVFTFDETTPFPSFFTLVPAVGTVLLILCANEGTLANRILGNRLLVGVGLISYSAYLWHQPLLAFAKHYSVSDPSAVLAGALCVATFPLAYLSWRYVEMPFRQKGLVKRRVLFTSAATVSAAFIAFGVIGYANDGFRARIDFPPNIEWTSFSERLDKQGDICELEPADGFDGLSVCSFGDAASENTVALYGDSHAQAISRELDLMLKRNRLKGIKVRMDRCEVVPRIVETSLRDGRALERCLARFSLLTEYLKKNADIAVVAIRWSFRLFPIDGVIDNLHFDNGIGGIERANYREFAVLKDDGGFRFDATSKSEALSELINGLSDALPIVLVYPIPEIGWDIFKENLDFYEANGIVLESLSFPKQVYDDRNRFIISIFEELSEYNDKILDVRPDRIFCESLKEGECVAQHESIPLYYDDDHLSDEGARLIVREIERRIH